MIELRNKRLSKYPIGNEKECTFDVVLEDKILTECYTDDVYYKGIGFEIKPSDFEVLIQVSGKRNIEDLVCYNQKIVPYYIGVDFYSYDWEKISLESGLLSIQKREAVSEFSYMFGRASDDWKYKYSFNHFCDALSDLTHDKVNISISFDSLNGWSIQIALKKEFVIGSISSIYSKFKAAIYDIEQEIYLILEGFKWKKDYHTDEPKFTKEVMIPLLKKMKYKNVRYNHGTEEYGRDVIFSEINKFGEEIFYGIQVKAGDVSGGANSQIDTLIGQLEDAFSMPVKLLGDEHERYLSFFIIAISGHYKKNAKEKILKKVPQAYKPHVFFWDKDSIEDLTGTYWKAD